MCLDNPLIHRTREDRHYEPQCSLRSTFTGTLTYITSRDLKFAKFVKHLQVLGHGVDGVCGCKESFGFGGEY